VQTVKRGLRAFGVHSGNFDAYLAKLLLNYRATARRDGRGSPSALMGRQLRSPLTLTFEIDAPVIYRSRSGAAAEPGQFIVQAGHNTAIIARDGGRPVLAHRDQFRPLPGATEQERATVGSEPEVTSTSQSEDRTDHLPSEPPERTSVVRCSERRNKGVPPDRFTPRW